MFQESDYMGICTPVDPLTHVGRLIVLPSVTITMVTNFGNIYMNS
jgi:hypothetical protein